MIEIGVLGPVTVTGWPEGPPPRPGVLEVAAFLALNPEHAWTTDTLIEAMSVESPRFKPETIRTYLTTLRRTLGPDRVPPAGPTGYTLTGVTTDWARLRSLTRPAPAGEDGDDRFASGLALVRAAPFAQVDPGTWDWVDRGTHTSLRADIDRTVTDLAATVATEAIAGGDVELARWATGRGLLLAPGSDHLHHLTLQAVALTRRTDRLDQAWTAITRQLHTIDETPDPALTAYYHHLRRQPDRTPPAGPGTPD
jgi:hypothetical protein